MIKLSLGLTFCLSIAVMLAGALPAKAQSNVGSGSIKVDTKRLDDASKIIPSRKKIYIEDDSPEIIDHRRGAPGQNTLILNIPPVQSTPGTSTVINVGQPGNAGNSTNGGAGGTGNRAPNPGPGQVVIDLNKLPVAGPESHMNSLNRGVSRNLPNGTSTGIHGRVDLPPPNTSAPTAGRRTPPQTTGRPATPPVTLMQPAAAGYKTGSSSGQSTQSSATVTGQRINTHPGLERLKRQ